jgi:hypothetical protein
MIALGIEGLEGEPVGNGAGHGIGGVDLGQPKILADVVAGVEPALLQAVVGPAVNINCSKIECKYSNKLEVAIMKIENMISKSNQWASVRCSV